MQPATTSLAHLPESLSEAVSRIVLIASWTALSRNPHVFTTISSASGRSSVISNPMATSCAAMLSLSTRFLEHPRLIKEAYFIACFPNVPFLEVF